MRRRLIPFLLLAFLISSCLPQPRTPLTLPWAYTDLLGVYPPGQAGSILPGQDLVAVYARKTNDDLEFRLDLLEVNTLPETDIYIAIGSTPSDIEAPSGDGAGSPQLNLGVETYWDSLVEIPAGGQIRAVDRQGRVLNGLAARVQRDPVAGVITISLNRSALPGNPLDYRFQVFLTPPGSKTVVDQSAPLSTAGQPPRRARVLLAFWNTFPAYTPVQALRRWDGAHTGPLGGRHGLHNLLRAARNRDIPLALLDLKTPTSLAALDYVQGLGLVKDMAANGLLILPDVFPPLVPQDPIPVSMAALELAANSSRATSRAFGLPSSTFLYAPLDPGMPTSPFGNPYRVIFAPYTVKEGQNSPLSEAYRRADELVIPVPIQNGSEGVASEDSSLELRRTLASAAAAAASNQGRSPGILVLGGDLPETPWGDPSFARIAMDYLVDHPWVQLLGAQDLLSLASNGGFRDLESSQIPDPQPQPIEALNAFPKEIFRAPPNNLAKAARQAYLALFAPTAPAVPELPALRAHYAGQVEVLLSAAGWAAHPWPSASCDLDLDQDGMPECVLSSATVYAVFESENGSLASLFVRSGASTRGDIQASSEFLKTGAQEPVHQLVGPSSQLSSGLGIPSDWNISSGLSADPQVYPGAFIEKPDAGPYQVSINGEALEFESANHSYTKTYRLVPNGLIAAIHSPDPSTLQIPLVLDPWTRFAPGWGERYEGQLTSGEWNWAVRGGPKVRVRASSDLTAYAFTETRDRMGSVEDPNLESPPGHYLPFPMSLVQIQGQGDYSIEVSLTN